MNLIKDGTDGATKAQDFNTHIGKG
jgi:hypothetical protein